MSTAQAVAASQSTSGPMAISGLVPREVYRLSPAEIRQAISGMVAEGRMELAVSIAEAALALHPKSEDVLVIASLLAEANQEWARAEALLVDLATVQGADSTAATWLHLIKVLNCQKKWDDAWLAAIYACERFPGDLDLAQELQTLSKMIHPESQTQAA
jgi:hypothetical protein